MEEAAGNKLDRAKGMRYYRPVAKASSAILNSGVL